MRVRAWVRARLRSLELVHLVRIRGRGRVRVRG